MLASALTPNAASGIKIPKVTSNAVMIGVVRIWTRSNRGPSAGTVELCLGGEAVGRVVRDEWVGKGRSSCRLCGLEPEGEPVMRRMEEGGSGGIATDGSCQPTSLATRHARSPFATLSLTRRFPPTAASTASSSTVAPHVRAHASRLSSSARLSGRLRYGMWTWASDGMA